MVRECAVGHPWKSGILVDFSVRDVGKNVIELNECLVSLRARWREQGVALGLVESSRGIFCGGKKDVGGAGGWHRKVVGEPIDRVGNSDGVGGRNPYLVASIVVEARANIVASSRVD